MRTPKERKKEKIVFEESIASHDEAEERRAGFPTRRLSVSGGQEEASGGQECPPSVGSPFFDRKGEIATTSHHLPHWQQGAVWIFVTWRLGDSLPQGKLDQWCEERKAWLGDHPQPWDGRTEAEYHEEFSGRIDEGLDQGTGSCL